MGEDTARYTVEVEGDQYDHEDFLNHVRDFNGAEVIMVERGRDH